MAAMDDAAGGKAGADPPLTVELLADLQAGLLDDDAAARLRKRIRADPQAQRALRALNEVRRDLATLGADPASAPDIPPGVVARITAALRSATVPAGRLTPPTRWRRNPRGADHRHGGRCRRRCRRDRPGHRGAAAQPPPRPARRPPSSTSPCHGPARRFRWRLPRSSNCSTAHPTTARWVIPSAAPRA
ncbi:hypothetical protein I552_8320 [Mycobacterium xenopi 3993]|nr:hypothetical protein I552_8320 [Mycobacterium xenopi 3993]